MTRSEQHKQIQELQYHAGAMSREDRDVFEMLVKRDKDDEDLDVAAVRSLEGLSERYVRKKSKSEAEEQWKKLTGGGKAPGPDV